MSLINRKSNKVVLIISCIVGALFILVLVPYLTNALMFLRLPEWIVPFGIEGNNTWIGYIASYFGAIIGGVISGLFTYLGVNKTLNAQKMKDDEDFRSKFRSILELQEIYDADLFLKNLKQKKGRLIITPQYKNAISLDLSDGKFNYIEFRNSGPDKAFNCFIKVETEYVPSGELFTTEVKVPVIFKGEKIFVPIDKIKGENNKILDMEKYFIKHIHVEYETFAKETIKIVRVIEEEGNKRFGIDQYSIKHDEKSEFVPLYDIKGTDNEWYFLEDFNEEEKDTK